MQDRFKFRIWDKFCETWLTDFAINQDGEINKFFNSEEALKRRFVLMQCTGLKDKNGKLIYEGDIIEFTDNVNINGSKTHIAKVEHREEFNAYMYHAECMGWYTINPSQNEVFKVKVIGNIYENPELLEDNK